MKELSEKEALHKAAAYCSQAEHCISEVSDKLAGWGIGQDAIDRIIEYLQKEKFIDENRYCENFVRDKFRFNKWGRLKIANALWQKKISSGISSGYLAQIDEEEYLETLLSLLSSRLRSIKAKDHYELTAKLMRFGMSRGFEAEYLKITIEKLLKQE